MAQAFVYVLVAAVAALPQVASQGSAGAPEKLVQALYADHFSNQQRWDLTLSVNRRAFGKQLLALLDAVDRKQPASPDNVVGLDFDPLTNSQQEATGFTVTRTSYQGGDALVGVVVNFGQETVGLKVRATKTVGGWRITNIHYPEGDLVTILKGL